MRMALEERIIAWSRDRPSWQRAVMRRVATGDVFATDAYDRLVEDILAGKEFPESTFGLHQLPQATPDDRPVRLVSIEKPEHVNALESHQPLTFEPNGLTIIYGDNASGKSGYARLLKRITRARHHEEVLSDVFRDNSLAKPTALLTVQIDANEESVNWPESTRPELQHMLFYDATCGTAYIDSESVFPYRPSALFVMDGLIEACIAVRRRVDGKLYENAALRSAVPNVPEAARDTAAGRFLAQLSGSTSVDVLDALIKTFEQSSETLDDLKRQEVQLRSGDTRKERQNLTRQGEKLDALRTHLENLHTVLGDNSLKTFQGQRNAFKTLEEAAALLAQSFETEPLPGVGGDPWKALWESAKRFSEEHAYAGKAFPVVEEDCRCVLCQEPLKREGRDRLSRFELFVKDDTQVRLAEARATHDGNVDRLTKLTVSPEAVVGNLKDLEASHGELVVEIREHLSKYETVREEALDALASLVENPQPGFESSAMLSTLTEASQSATAAAEGLSNPETIQQRIAELTSRSAELALSFEVKRSRNAIVNEITRRKEHEALEAAKSEAATGAITKKISDLSEESITEVVRDAFTRETDRLHLERVTITRTRADKGALLHQPKLVGARQQVTLPRVFSEGERTALGLAAFFTEAQLEASKSALILDDPVTSLDHIRRSLVAARLAAFAETRQVVVFTHDVSFVADLKREANGKGVPIAERSVTRSRAVEKKPGACSTKHPWKAKDVGARLDELRNQLARIKRESSTWEDKDYEDEVAIWAGNLSETWERMLSQEIAGPLLAEGGLEVRPNMVKIITRFSNDDEHEFQASYSRVSQWAKRHDKSLMVNYVAPDVATLDDELTRVTSWFKRVKGYSK